MAPLAVTRTFRVSESHLVFPVWQIIEETPDDEQADAQRISQALAKSMGLPELEVMDLLEQLTVDGLVIQECSTKTAIFSLPNLKKGGGKHRWDILQSRDCYCYECHGAGEMWLCSQCPRVFHPDCVRPSTDVDLPLLPLKDPVPDVVRDTFLQVYGFPYTKFRNGTSTPYPIAGDSDNPDEFQRTCINCRLRQDNKLEVRDADRLIPLLDSAFPRIRSWINLDTFSAMESKSMDIPAKYLERLSTVLFQKVMTADDIKRKIDDGMYTSLVEFQCDIMDMVHCIGVLRGVNCAEFEAAKYLLLDSLHEINEIANCQDCYEHSAAQDNNKGWFIKPCRPPHELVFAKQTGFSYWPAKVIRRTPNQVDVRFFGQQHMRAVINVRNVKSIDKMPAVKRSAKFEKAMAELRQHREILSNLPDSSDSEDGNVDETTMEIDVCREALVARRRTPVSDAELNKTDDDANVVRTIDETDAGVTSSTSSDKRVEDPPQQQQQQQPSLLAEETESSSSVYSDYQLPNPIVLAQMEQLAADGSSNGDPSNSQSQSESIPSGSEPVTTEVATIDDRTNISNETNLNVVQIEVEPTSSESSSANVFTGALQALTNGSPVVAEAAPDACEHVAASEPILDRPNGSKEQQQNQSVDATPPAIGTPIDFQKFITNLEIAMIGCPQQFIDSARTECEKYAHLVQSELARRAEALMAAKVQHFCCMCFQAAHFHCCLGTSYCTAACQSLGWIRGHKDMCARARTTNASMQTDG